jgi:CheY-like chemotaxis protein
MIVMDINMPGMDGVVATNKIREFNDPYVKKID